ncbi:MAG TPA: hypothetical protein VIO94_16905 [Phenylobacterium sp.]
MSASDRNEHSADVGATRARQGRWGFHVFLVLVIGLVLAALALFGSWFWKSGDLASTEPNNGREQVDAKSFNAPEPQAIQTPPGTNNTAQAPEDAGPAPGTNVPGAAR